MSFEKKHFYTRCAGLSVYVRSLQYPCFYHVFCFQIKTLGNSTATSSTTFTTTSPRLQRQFFPSLGVIKFYLKVGLFCFSSLRTCSVTQFFFWESVKLEGSLLTRWRGGIKIFISIHQLKREIKMMVCNTIMRQEKKKFVRHQYFYPSVNCVCPASKFRHQGPSGTVFQGLVWHCPAMLCSECM
jgi:hypothetical protein